jgi:hypothetical protein
MLGHISMKNSETGNNFAHDIVNNTENFIIAHMKKQMGAL